jgi:hypothetical protein
MRLFLALLAVVHGLIHLMGPAKAFGFAALPQLTIPISRSVAVLWLLAAALLFVSAAALYLWPRWWWVAGALAVAVSQAVIITSWTDAKFGTLANVVLLAAAVYGAFAWGPFGLRAEYEQRAARAAARLSTAPPVTEAELASLPAPVQRYLRYAGVVGHPHVRSFRVRFSGRIRSGPDAPWMPFTGEQHSFLEPPTRLFFMHATMRGLPVDALHAYEGTDARMRVKALSVVPVVDASGVDFTRTETVTLFNDMCIMAPATLVDPAIRWETIDAKTVEATYTNAPHTIRAVLSFNEEGALVNFWSDDRPALAPDGVTFVPQRWSTPVGEYRAQGPFRLASRGAARYAAPGGEYAYIEFDGLEVSYDLAQK